MAALINSATAVFIVLLMSYWRPWESNAFKKFLWQPKLTRANILN